MSKRINILISVLGAPHKSGKEMLFQCPKCDHHKKKMSVNLSKNAFKCWVCDFSGKNISFLVRKYGSPQSFQAWSRLTGETRSSPILEAEPEEKPLLPKGLVSLCTPIESKCSAPYRRYLKSRGITNSDIYKWKMGYTTEGPFRSRVIIPSFDKAGSLTYFIARDIEDSKYKYRNPRFSRDIIFNDLMIDWSAPIVLVEGVFDAINFDNAIPLLGSTLPESGNLFQKIIEKKPQVFLGLDRDASRKEEKIIRSLLLQGIELYKMPSPPLSDYGSLDKDSCVKIQEKSHFVEGTDYLLYRKIFLEAF